MSHSLIIVFPPGELSPESELFWMLEEGPVERGRGSELANGRSPLHKLAADASLFAEDFDVIAVMPTESVLLTTVEIPSSQLRQIRQALPFMVEEQIADDIENVHTAIATQLKERLPKVDAAVVEHRQLVEWLDLLHSHQLSPQALLLDALCLPHEPQGWTLLVQGERLLIRNGRDTGTVFNFADVDLLLPAIFEQYLAERTQSALDGLGQAKVQVLAGNPAESQSKPQSNGNDRMAAHQIAELLQSHCPDFDIKLQFYDAAPEELLSYDWHQQRQEGINLLQGGYAVASARAETSGYWHKPAKVAGWGLLAYLLIALLGGWFFSYQSTNIKDQSIALYRSLFPAERRVVNPRRQMENHLGNTVAVNNNHFLPMMTEMAKVLRSQGTEESLSLQQIRFNSEDGDLRLEVRSDSLEQLDALKNRLANQGLLAEINSASEQEDVVVGRILVRGQ